jgi:hypothetical protein
MALGQWNIATRDKIANSCTIHSGRSPIVKVTVAVTLAG